MVFNFYNVVILKNLLLFIMSLILTIFPYASPEIVTAAVICFLMTLFGLSLGFALLKVQGE
jgi:hypothetical protein